MIAENEPQDNGFEDVRLMAAGDLAQALRVSVRQAHRMNKAGLIPRPLRIGGCVRWRAGEIERWLDVGAPLRDEWEKQQDAELAPTVEDANGV